MSGPSARVLTLNAGSSSLKLALFEATDPPQRIWSGSVGRVGASAEAPDHAAALASALARLQAQGLLDGLAGVGHRIVHGGPRLDAPCEASASVLDELRRLAVLDPDHMPAEIAIVEAMSTRTPTVPQVLCFDTAFHRSIPRVARLVAIPHRYEAMVQRYGFHGLSYEFLLERLARVAGEEAARARVVLAHLGAGSSLAAVRDGRCVDTTMGFTPTAGVPMGTRSGDLDPGVLLYLLRTGMTADALDALVNHESGLLGLSGSSADMRDLLAREGQDARAADAVAVYCYCAAKAVGALAAALGGIDTLVFAGGIGENAAPVRERVAARLGHLGVRIDAARNAAGAGIVSADGSPCTVRVIPTDEESIIARHTLHVLEGGKGT
jgi:acetate kinase